MKKALLLLLLLLATIVGKAQDIAGEWRGDFGGGFLNGGLQELVVTLNLYNDSMIEGYSKLYYSSGKFEHYKVHGVYHKADSTIYFSEDEEIEVSLGFWATNAMGNYTMKLSMNDSMMRFDGKWKENKKSSFGALNSKVWLEKPIPRKKPSPAIAKKTTPKPKAPKRDYKVQGSMTLGTSDSIRIEITDNANVDGDMISLYVDDSLIVHQQKITEKPIVLNLAIHNKRTQIRMVAESQGSVPPCTAHIVIISNDKKHEQDVWSDYAINGVIELVRE